MIVAVSARRRSCLARQRVSASVPTSGDIATARLRRACWRCSPRELRRLALLAALIDAALGLLLAWVLVRYRFPGRGLVNGLVDLPVALPTAVAGQFGAGHALRARNRLDRRSSLFEPLGIKIAFATPLGIGVALAFIGLPFVVRTVEPVLADLEREDIEEAAADAGRQPGLHRSSTGWCCRPLGARAADWLRARICTRAR